MSSVPSVPSVEVNRAADPRAAAVLLHPHPDYGGDRFNIVVDALYRALPPAGVSAVRFDFSSSDVVVAAGEAVSVVDAVNDRPVVLMAYSFGADVATTIADDRLAGWFLIAPPLSDRSLDRPIAADARPKAIAVPERDQFSSPGRTSHLTSSWTNTTVSVVAGADHFLADATGVVVDRALEWLKAAVLM